MAKKRAENQVPDSEILSYSNVPVDVAAKYLGVSVQTLRDSLRQNRAPYGYATKCQESNSWTFHISPGLLVSYQSGKLQAWDTKWLVEQIAADVERVVESRYKNAIKMLCEEMLHAGQA